MDPIASANPSYAQISPEMPLNTLEPTRPRDGIIVDEGDQR
jgi:hypothetical protein